MYAIWTQINVRLCHVFWITRYASVASYADVRVASAMSGRSAEKIGSIGLQFFHNQSKIEISEDANGDGVILLDNVSTTIIFKRKIMVNNIRNVRYRI